MKERMGRVTQKLANIVGQRIVNQNAGAPQALHRRVEFGDILILKTRIPKAPGPLTTAAKTGGL